MNLSQPYLNYDLCYSSGSMSGATGEFALSTRSSCVT
jgi:hypothetical protein